MKRCSSVIIRHFSTVRHAFASDLCSLLLAGLFCPVFHAPAEGLLSCSGGAGGDRNTHGVYVPEDPGVTLASAQLQFLAFTPGHPPTNLTAVRKS